MTLSFFPVPWPHSYLGYFSPVFSQLPITKNTKCENNSPKSFTQKSVMTWITWWQLKMHFFLPKPVRDSGSQHRCRSRLSTKYRSKTGKLKFFCMTGPSEWFKVHSITSHICIHLIHPHFCLSSVIALAKGIWKILQRHLPSLDIQFGLGRKTKYFIKIKLTWYCCTNKSKSARNWLRTGDTSCPSWMGAWIGGWTDRFCTPYCHNWI